MFTTLLYIISAVIIVIYFYIQWCHSYWKRIGVPYDEPHFLYGNAGDLVKRTTPLGQFIANNYNKFKSRGLKHAG